MPIGIPPDELARLRIEERKLAALRELNRALATTVDLDQLLVLLLDKLCALMDAERVTLYLVEGEALTSSITQGGEVAEIRLAMGEGIAGWVAQTNETVNLVDAYTDPRFHKEIDQRTGFRTTSMLCMPMPDSQGRALGVLQVLNKRARAFDGDDESMLATVAAHAGISVENSRLYVSVVAQRAELQRKVADLDLLLEIEHEVAAAHDLDDLLHRLLARAVQLVRSEAGAIVLRDPASGQMYFRSTVGGSGEATKRVKLAEGKGVVGWVAHERKPLIVNDPSSDPRHDQGVAEVLGFHPRNLLAVPLVQAAPEDGTLESLGAIELLNRVGRDGYDAEDEKLLLLIAGHASRALELARGKEARQQQERLAAVGQLLSGVLHDLRTPMTVVSGYAQIMVNTDDAQKRAEYSAAIQKQFDLMSAMTREVLEFARGESKLLVRRVYMQKFAEEIKEQLEPDLRARNVELVVDGRYVGVAWFDELKLVRAIHNLARNAAQAMPEGGRLTITIDSVEDQLRIDVADTGGGIPPELEGRLFQLFATSGKEGGTGLGLAIVKKIVEEHGGRIAYRSRAGEGTTFTITLPLQRDEA